MTQEQFQDALNARVSTIEKVLVSDLYLMVLVWDLDSHLVLPASVSSES